MNGKREFGDYQTPSAFADKVCAYLKDHRHIHPSAVVEPTCGVGHFLKSSLTFGAKEYYGIEINPEYCDICQASLSGQNVEIIHSDFFAFSSKSLIQDQRQVLVIGNPPWVTNSALSALGSDNLPVKSNFKGQRGIDALTGASNFDICEYIILQLIGEYQDSNAVISMLCKTSVARNVFTELMRNNISFSSCDILEFDAAKVFHINASACLLVIQLSNQPVAPGTCSVYDFEDPEMIKFQLRYSGGQLYRNIDDFSEKLDGHCCFEWRQGIKHDCSKVMELSIQNGTLQNGQKEHVDIEDNIVFPLVKSSMFKSPVIHSFSKYVIVTQKKAREETSHLASELPKTWNYLSEHIALFERRKSSIYRGAPPFSMFGIGDYSYAKYKVGISGFYKQPLFSLLYSDDGKPVMTDDTCYFIGFDCFDMAYVAMLLLNSEEIQTFLTSIAFLDAKRPYTKKVLERIDFHKAAAALTIQELHATEQKLELPSYVTVSMYDAFRAYIGMEQLRLA